MLLSKILLLLSATLILFSCEREPTDCCNDNTTALFESTSIDYASNFDLVKTNIGYSLKILNPENGELEKTISIKTEKNKIISLSATVNGMISNINAQKFLAGVGNRNYIYDSIILNRIINNEILEFGDEMNISTEKIISSSANIILYSGFGNEFPNESKLNKLNINIIPIYDWREQHPLGKAEWIKLIGVLMGKEKEANTYFDYAVREYEKILSATDTLSNLPSVLSGSLYGDIWYAPGGNGYFSTLLKDAGANYIYSATKGTASQEYSMEKILKDNLSTDYWINSGLSTKAAINNGNPKAKYLKAYKSSTYCYSGNLNKFWEQSASAPHIVLRDLVQILHPEIKLSKELYFYKRIE